jgi:uncharacterized membrane protein
LDFGGTEFSVGLVSGFLLAAPLVGTWVVLLGWKHVLRRTPLFRAGVWSMVIYQFMAMYSLRIALRFVG